MTRPYNRIAEEWKPRRVRERELRKYAGQMPLWQIAEKMELHQDSVRAIAYQFGISLAFHQLYWSPQEDEVLRKTRAAGVQYKDISRMLPGRSWRACRGRYAELKRKGEI